MPQNYNDNRQTLNQDSGWAGECATAQTLSTGQSDWNDWSSHAHSVNMESHYSGSSSASNGHGSHQEPPPPQQQQYGQESRSAQERYESHMQQHRDQQQQQQQQQQWSEQAAQNQWNAVYRDQQPQYTRQHSYQGSSASFNTYQPQSHSQPQQSLSSQQHHLHHQVHHPHGQSSNQQQFQSHTNQQEHWSGDHPGQHQHAGDGGGDDPVRRKSEEWPQTFSDDCWSGCGTKLAPHMEVFTMLTKTEGDSLGRTNFKKQNNYLMKVLFDDSGECVYHADCILRIFKISKGRLKRLQERIKREMRGEIARHGLYGRPSNNRKKPSGQDDDMESPMSGHGDGGRAPMFEPGDHAAGAAAVCGIAGQYTDDDECGDLESDHEGTRATDKGRPTDMEEDGGRRGSASAKRPGSSEVERPAKRHNSASHASGAGDQDSEEGSEVGTDGISMTGSMTSNEGKSNSGGSDSGLGSSAGGRAMPAPHLKHKIAHHVHHGADVKKKAGNDSDGSSGPGDLASPELD